MAIVLEIFDLVRLCSIESPLKDMARAVARKGNVALRVFNIYQSGSKKSTL